MEFVTLLDMVRVPVVVSRVTQEEHCAMSPHWPGVACLAKTAEGAVVKLVYVLEAKLASGQGPTPLPMTP